MEPDNLQTARNQLVDRADQLAASIGVLVGKPRGIDRPRHTSTVPASARISAPRRRRELGREGGYLGEEGANRARPAAEATDEDGGPNRRRSPRKEGERLWWVGFPLRVAFACALMGPHTATGGLVSKEELGSVDTYGTWGYSPSCLI
jgi:hypothetical protein